MAEKLRIGGLDLGDNEVAALYQKVVAQRALSDADIEVWKDVVGYEGFYEISNLGRVRTLSRLVPNGRWKGKFFRKTPSKLMSPRFIGPSKVKYLTVDLSRKNRKASLKVHRLVLEAFVGPCPDGMEGCHNDGDTANNRLENLRWDTRRNNNADKIRHGTNVGNRGNCKGINHPRAKLTESQVRRIRWLWKSKGISAYALARQHSLDKSTVQAIVEGVTWKHLLDKE